MTPPELLAPLIEAALGTARGLGLEAELVQAQPKLGRARPDALIRLGRENEGALYAVEVKRGMRPATLGATIHELERLGEQALLIADYVTPAMADTLRARRIPFLDAAGNAYIEQPGMLIWVKGQKPATPMVPLAMGRAFQPTGLQVVFALLCDPQRINMPYRELAQCAGVAHGTVGWVIPDLEQQGFTAKLKGKRGTRRLYRREELLAQWVDAYARQLRPRLLLERYYAPTIEDWKKWPVATHDALWGEEPAGALLTEYLRPGALTIYAAKLPGMLAARQKLAKAPALGRAMRVEMRRKFWTFPEESETRAIAPPVLVYADLLATGDARCIETAKLVYEGHVARLFDKE
ncbi:MAG: type IV toxin-antitoxin system AbiEi family antitoxin [Usitatibacter sp.]